MFQDLGLAVSYAKIFAVLGFLLWASVHDYRSREVPNKIWGFFLPLGVALTLIELYNSSLTFGLIFNLVFSATLSIALFYLAFHLGLYGGADAKGLIGIALITPWRPAVSEEPLLGIILPVFPLSVLNNALLLTLLLPLYALASNVALARRGEVRLFAGFEHEPLHRKIGAMLLCLKIPSRKLRSFDLVAEEPVGVGGDGARRFVLFRRVEEAEESPSKALEKPLPPYLFITLGVPLIIFITIGFGVALVLGDLIFWTLSRFLTPLPPFL